MDEREAESQSAAISNLERAYQRLRVTARGATADIAFDLRSSTSEIRKMESETSALSRSFGSGLRRAFDSAIFSGDKLSDVMRNLALSMSRSVLHSALTPVQNSLGGAVTGLFAGFAKGAAFSSGRVRAFAKGRRLRRHGLSDARRGRVDGGSGPGGDHAPDART